MRTALRGIIVLAVAVVSSAPATAHHSEARYFDMTKAITLEGLILRVEWINPHALLFLQSKNEKGELETWTIQGAGLVVVARKDWPGDVRDYSSKLAFSDTEEECR